LVERRSAEQYKLRTDFSGPTTDGTRIDVAALTLDAR